MPKRKTNRQKMNQAGKMWADTVHDRVANEHGEERDKQLRNREKALYDTYKKYEKKAFKRWQYSQTRAAQGLNGG